MLLAPSLPASPSSADSPLAFDELEVSLFDVPSDSLVDLSLDFFLGLCEEAQLDESPEPELLRGRKSAPGVGVWTASEHRRFRQAEKLFPNGPWRSVAAFVKTRTTKQTISHAHKCRERRKRHAQGLKTPGRKPRARSDDAGSGSDRSGERDWFIGSDDVVMLETSDLLLHEITADEQEWARIEELNADLEPFDDLTLTDVEGIAEGTA